MKAPVWEPRHWMTSRCPWPCPSESGWPWLAHGCMERILYRRQNLLCEAIVPCLSGRSPLGIYISTRVHQRMGPPRTQGARGSWNQSWVWEGHRLIGEPLKGWSPLEDRVLRKVIQGPSYSKTAGLHLCILCFWPFILWCASKCLVRAAKALSDPPTESLTLQVHCYLGKLNFFPLRSYHCRIRATLKCHSTARIPPWSWGQLSICPMLLALGSCLLPSWLPSTSLSSVHSWAWIWEGPVCPTHPLHLQQASQPLPPLPAPSTKRMLMRQTG